MSDTPNMLAELSTLLDGYKMAMGGLDNPGLTWSIELLSNYFDEVVQAQEQGKPIAYTNFGVCPELFWAMDVTPVVVEVVNGLLAPTPHALRYIDQAEVHVPDYLCSSNKLYLGALLSGEIPTPALMVQSSKPCDSNLGTYPVIAETMGYPYFCIDMPYQQSEKAVDYVAGELDRLVRFIEENTGHALDLERLRQAMIHSNTAHTHSRQLAAFRERIPCPYSSLDNLAEYPTVLSLAGTPQLADYFTRRFEMTRDQVERGEGFLPAEQERIRMAWIYGAPAYDLFFFMTLEQQYGAVAVANMNNNFLMDPVADLESRESMLRGLARKTQLLPMTRECGGPWERYLDASIDICRRFKADVAVFAGHVACKANWAIIKLIKDRLQDELSIPVMVLEMDLFDPRVLSTDALAGRFEEFFGLHFPG